MVLCHVAVTKLKVEEGFLGKFWDPTGIWPPHYLRFVPRREVGLRKLVPEELLHKVT